MGEQSRGCWPHEARKEAKNTEADNPLGRGLISEAKHQGSRVSLEFGLNLSYYRSPWRKVPGSPVVKQQVHTHRHIQTHTDTYTHMQTHTHSHTHIHRHTLTHKQSHTHTLSHSHTQTYTLSHFKLSLTHTYTVIPTHTHHTDTLVHTHIHRDIHTHTHKQGTLSGHFLATSVRGENENRSRRLVTQTTPHLAMDSLSFWKTGRFLAIM